MAKKKSDTKYAVGDWVVFNGWSDPENIPEGAEGLLEEGTAYEVKSAGMDEGGEEVVYSLEVDNPDFDSSKRASKNNPKTTQIEVFEDELSAYEEEEAEEEEGEEEAEEEGEYEEEEEGEEEEEEEEEEADSSAISKNDKFWLPDNEVDSEIIETIQQYEDPNEYASEVAGDAAESEYRLGAVLHYVYSTKSYQDVEGCDEKGGFAKYCEEYLGLQYRMAMNHIQVYVAFRKSGIGADKIREIGWTKCLVISRVMDEENAEQLIELAANEETVDSLKSTIKENFSTSSGTSQTGKVFTRVTFKYRLLDATGELVEEIMNLAKESLALESDDDVFAHIVTDWANNNLDVSSRKMTSLAKKSDKAIADYLKHTQKDEPEEEEEEEAPAPAKATRKKATKKKVAKKTASKKVSSKKTPSKKVSKKKVSKKVSSKRG